VTADAEGLTIYYRGEGKGYLMASSQGDSTFAVYRREGSNAYLGQFRISEHDGVDGDENSDGSTVLNVPLGEFDEGLFVTHDGVNTPAVPDRENTNFKYTGWDDIADELDLDVDTDGWDPRD
jgi:3-phytase